MSSPTQKRREKQLKREVRARDLSDRMTFPRRRASDDIIIGTPSPRTQFRLAMISIILGRVSRVA